MSGLRRIGRGQHTEHRCPGACGRLVPNRLLACDEDWARLPRDIRRAVVRHTRGGKTGPARDQVTAAASAWFLANPPWHPLANTQTARPPWLRPPPS